MCTGTPSALFEAGWPSFWPTDGPTISPSSLFYFTIQICLHQRSNNASASHHPCLRGRLHGDQTRVMRVNLSCTSRSCASLEAVGPCSGSLMCLTILPSCQCYFMLSNCLCLGSSDASTKHYPCLRGRLHGNQVRVSLACTGMP